MTTHLHSENGMLDMDLFWVHPNHTWVLVSSQSTEKGTQDRKKGVLGAGWSNGDIYRINRNMCV